MMTNSSPGPRTICFRQQLKKPFDFLLSAIQSAHRAIVSHAVEHNLLECPRTTCVACIVQNGAAYWAHAGDSRLYVLRTGQLLAVTQDHSKIQQMIDAGEITPEAAARHPDRNKIFSCLGGVIPPQIASGRELAAKMTPDLRAKLIAAMPDLKERATTLVELIESARYIYADRPIALDHICGPALG